MLWISPDSRHACLAYSLCIVLSCDVVKLLIDKVSQSLLLVQRFAAGSLFKRTIYQHIAEDMLAADSVVNSAVSCPIDSQARPLVISTTDSPLQSLLQSLEFDDGNNIVDRQKVSDGLQRLGNHAFHLPMCLRACGAMAMTVLQQVSIRCEQCMVLLCQLRMSCQAGPL